MAFSVCFPVHIFYSNLPFHPMLWLLRVNHVTVSASSLFIVITLFIPCIAAPQFTCAFRC